MPADRTTTNSFQAAASLKLPLSSHGSQHAPSLERGKACLTCRSRKVRCDSARPACGSCLKSAGVHGDDPALIICDYDDVDKAKGDKKKKSGGTGSNSNVRVSQLEAEVLRLQQIIDNSPRNYSSNEYQQPIASTSAYNSQFETDQQYYEQDRSPLPVPSSSSSHNRLEALAEVTSDEHQYGLPRSWKSTFHNTLPPASLVPVNAPDPLLEIFFPGWPGDLPSPSITNRLIEVYFSRNHAASGMLNQRKIQTSMVLSPTHVDFPHTSLIHSMLATASRMVSDGFFNPEDKYWGASNPYESVSDYHSINAKRAIDEAIPTGIKLFQVAQATIILTFHSYCMARFVEVWLLSGLAIRMITPLGLNHLRALSAETVNTDSSLSNQPNKSTLLQPTFNEEELYERSVTFWMGIVADRLSSANTGWSLGIEEADISSLLPSPPGAFMHDTDAHLSPLSLKNPNLLISHPPHLIQPLQLYLKAVTLLGRVVTFVQRCPSPIGMSMNGSKPSPLDPKSFSDLRTGTEFKKLDSDIVAFRLSTPREYQTTQYYTLEPKIALIYALPFAATILLHENFCTMADEDASLSRCLAAARAILEAIYTLWSSSFELSLLLPYSCFTWAVAGRTLVRELAIKQAKSQYEGQESLINDIMTIMSAMRACRTPLGDSSAAALQQLLSNPDHSLPYQDVTHLGLGFGMGKAFTDDNNYTGGHRTTHETYAAYNNIRSSNSGTSNSDSPINSNNNGNGHHYSNSNGNNYGGSNTGANIVESPMEYNTYRSNSDASAGNTGGGRFREMNEPRDTSRYYH